MTSSIPPLPPVTIDAERHLLCLGDREVQLQPRVLGLLQCLASRPGQVIGKEQLLDEVWGHRFITEGVIKTAISELRAALGDDVKQPRWIETLARRGYRYIGTALLAAAAPAGVSPPQRSSTLIGREDALAALQARWAAACQGQPGVLLVAGDAGMGKTALLSEFMHGLDQRSGDEAVVAVGQSVEALGEGEPYLPFLEALSPLLAQQPGLLAELRRVAPTWLSQMPWHVALEDREALAREVAGASQERMLREFAVLLDQATQTQPWLVVVEDLHWSDSASVQLLGHLARRRSSGRWLVVGSFRPVDVAASEHPLGDMRRELRLHGQVREIALDGLNQAQLAALTTARCPGAQPSAAFLAQLHRHTDGLPLFAERVLSELLEQGLLRPLDEGGWRFPEAGHPLPLPPTLIDLMERQIDRLPAAARQMLEVAALSPHEFDDVVLAEVLGIAPADVRQRLDGLVRRRLWLLAREPRLVSGERVAASYGFQHALMRHAFEQRTPAAGRMALHRRLGQAIEAVYGDCCGERSVELAEHARLGREPLKAARHYNLAGQQALQRIAPFSALDLVRVGLGQLDQLEAGRETDEARVDLLLTRVRALVATRGYSIPCVEDAYALVSRWPLSARTLPVWYAAIRARHNVGRWAERDELLARLEGLRDQPDAGWLVAAICANARGFVNTHRNQPLEALPHLERALQLFEAHMHQPGENPQLLLDFEINTLCHHYIACVELGDATRAAATAERLEARLRQGVMPLNESMALFYLSNGAQLQGDEKRLAGLTRRAQALLATRESLPLAAPNGVMHGWSLCQSGARQAGIAKLQEALRSYETQNLMPGRMYYLQLLARQAMAAGDLTLADRCLDSCEALHAQGETSLRGEVLLTRAARLALTPPGRAAALECLHEAQAYAEARGLGRLLEATRRERRLLGDGT
ncbi:AAA family ATPase [Roseateles sp.]|uniref:AAA family ATPase n=1 Tax=Roseateles sp. TaxID=1971397 RepID=UPI0039E943DB